MSLISLISGRFRNAITESHALAELIRGSSLTSSGAMVTTDAALTLGPVFSAVRVLAESLGQIPVSVLELTPQGRKKAPDHPLTALLEQPNTWQTGPEWREMSQAHVALCGNAYSMKTVVRGETRELLPVPPNRVTVEQSADYKLIYNVTMPDGRPMPVPQDRMLHIRGLSWNGRAGLSVVSYMREVIGVGLQQVQFGARLYSNGATLRGVIKHPKAMKKDAMDRLKAQFDDVYSGAHNAHKVMLLEEGAEFQKTGMTAEDAEFLDSRKFTRSEIASWFRIPPHMIGDLERATFSNIEQQALEFVQWTLMPWITRWEAQISRSLLSDKDRAVFYPKFVVQGLMRGDFKSRVDGYGQAIKDGWMNRNEVRELEDMNTVDGLDEFLVPLNMGKSQDPPPEGKE